MSMQSPGSESGPSEAVPNVASERRSARSTPPDPRRNLTGAELTDLVSRAKAGEQRSWESLVAGLSRAVYRGLASYAFPKHVVEELFQDTFIRLVENLDSIQDPCALPRWMIVTAGNEAKRYLRRSAHSIPVAVVPERVDQTGPDERLLDSELHRAVLAGFRRLSPSCQELLGLLTVDPPLSYAEIAGLLGRTIGDVGPTRSRCLEKLRRTPEIAAFLETNVSGTSAGERKNR